MLNNYRVLPLLHRPLQAAIAGGFALLSFGNVMAAEFCSVPNTNGGRCSVSAFMGGFSIGVEPYTCAGIAKANPSVTGQCVDGFLEGFAIFRATTTYKVASSGEYSTRAYLTRFNKGEPSLELAQISESDNYYHDATYARIVDGKVLSESRRCEGQSARGGDAPCPGTIGKLFAAPGFTNDDAYQKSVVNGTVDLRKLEEHWAKTSLTPNYARKDVRFFPILDDFYVYKPRPEVTDNPVKKSAKPVVKNTGNHDGECKKSVISNGRTNCIE